MGIGFSKSVRIDSRVRLVNALIFRFDLAPNDLALACGDSHS